MIWSVRSRNTLRLVNANLIAVLSAAVHAFEKETDYTVVAVSGHRSSKEQLELFKAGKTPLRSGSNHQTGNAVDVAILDRDGKYVTDLDVYEEFNAIVQEASEHLGIGVVWGGDWLSKDGPHFELS